MRREDKSGQALLLFVVVLGIFLLGIVGLAVDAAQLYCYRQAAQSAADAAAQAGAMSLLVGTNKGANNFVSGTCPDTAWTPCHYASLNGFQASETTLTVTSSSVKATITHNVPTTFMRVLGINWGTVAATATAAVQNTPSAIPIIVLHPTLPGALSYGGTATAGQPVTVCGHYLPSATGILICGGPPRSVQVNSYDAAAVSQNGQSNMPVNLSYAGPNGTGGDFGVFGGPADKPSSITARQYLTKEPPIPDPFLTVNPPSDPGTLGTTSSDGTAGHTFHGCTVDTKPCVLYKPGKYPGGIKVTNQHAIFAPGIYYITQGPGGGGHNQGFTIAANGSAMMCRDSSPECAADATLGADDSRMLVYLSGDDNTLNIGSNAQSVELLGSSVTSSYKGILFFKSRSDRAATHNLGGGGALSVTGTVYLTSSPGEYSTRFQSLELAGNTGSTTDIVGEIIVDQLVLKGGGAVVMTLSSSPDFMVQQVALIR